MQCPNVMRAVTAIKKNFSYELGMKIRKMKIKLCIILTQTEFWYNILQLFVVKYLRDYLMEAIPA